MWNIGRTPRGRRNLSTMSRLPIPTFGKTANNATGSPLDSADPNISSVEDYPWAIEEFELRSSKEKNSRAYLVILRSPDETRCPRWDHSGFGVKHFV